MEILHDNVRLYPPGKPPTLQVQDILGGDEEPDEEGSFAFGLEAELRDFLAHNLNKLKVGDRKLTLFKDPSDREGIEYPTDVGRIDILATDEHGQFVVFELKLEHGPDRALGQLARYMGWIRMHLSPNDEVSGVIVAKNIDDKLRYAVTVVPNVTLLKYEVSFKVEEAPPISKANN